MAGTATAAIDASLAAVRADLTARIAAIHGRAADLPARDLAREVDAIRLLAHRHGLAPAVTVAHVVRSALSRGEHGPLVHGWLAMLGEAVASERQDLAACETFAAACSVRLAS